MSYTTMDPSLEKGGPPPSDAHLVQGAGAEVQVSGGSADAKPPAVLRLIDGVAVRGMGVTARMHWEISETVWNGWRLPRPLPFSL